MSRWIPRTLLLIAAVAVLVLGAAAHGFEPSLRGVSASTSTEPASTIPVPQRRGPALRVSVVRLLVDSADNSTAVIVSVANPDSRRAITNAPITIDLFDRADKIVGTNGDAGTDSLLTHVPYIGPGESTLFVSDTIATSATPSHARAGATATFSPVQHAQLTVRTPRLRKGPFGWVADATLVNLAGAAPRKVLIQAVVQLGEKVTAAGTKTLAVPPRGRPAGFEIFLIGDAKGGALRVWAPPQ